MKRVGVLRGGTGEQYESSLRKGGDVIFHIFKNSTDKYKVVDILIDKEGIWHLNGVPIMPAELINKVDVVWNAAQPNSSMLLDNLSISNVSASPFSFILENNKEMLREHMKNIGIDMPQAIILPVYQKDFDGPRERYSIKKAKEIHEKFSAPWIVKSLTPDASMGIHLAKTFPELVNSIEDGVSHGQSILVEEFISGKVASMHCVPDFRGQDFYTFPLGNTFGDFSSTEKEKLSKIAKDLHKHIGAEPYLKSNFILNPRGRVYLLGIESKPDLKQGSHLDQACGLVGAKMHHVIEHIIEQALYEK